MFTVKSNFIGNFKLGDNINHNLKILKLLYRYFDSANDEEKRLLCKPIIIALGSITEAILHDFHERIKVNVREGVNNLADEIIDYIRGKQIDKFEKYIVSARKHNLFGVSDENFYKKLDSFRKLRNRVHIQNTEKHFEKDEYEAFTLQRKISSEKILEQVVKVMSIKYSRGKLYSFVDEFEFPWPEHFPKAECNPLPCPVCGTIVFDIETKDLYVCGCGCVF